MTAIQTAAANTVFRIANLYEQNCALKHGLPKVGGPDRVEAEAAATTENTTERVSSSRTETTTASAVTESPSPGEGAAAVGGASLWRRAAPLLVGAAVGAGVPLVTLLRPTKTDTPPVITQPTAAEKDGSLLQWLQDQGRHLPGGEQWPTNLPN